MAMSGGVVVERAVSPLVTCEWFHDQHLKPWLPRLCVVALNAADAELAFGMGNPRMKETSMKYGVAAYFDGLRTAAENLGVWYREGDGQDGSCSFEFLLASYLLSANTDLGHVVDPHRLGYKPTKRGDTARVARYVSEVLKDEDATFSHRTCFTALWDLDPRGELESCASCAASRVKGAATCVLMLLSMHKEFFEMGRDELARAATRIARDKLARAGFDLGCDGFGCAPSPPPEAEVASARRADRVLREVLCGGDDASPSPYVGYVVRRMNRFVYSEAGVAIRVIKPVAVRATQTVTDAVTPPPPDEQQPPPQAPDASPVADLRSAYGDDECDDGDGCCGCDLEGLDVDGECSSWEDDPDADVTMDEVCEDGDSDGEEMGDASDDGDCALYRALATPWLE